MNALAPNNTLLKDVADEATFRATPAGRKYEAGNNCRDKDSSAGLEEQAFEPGGQPLYHLEKLLCSPGAPVVVVDGKAAADTLVRHGVLATASGSKDASAVDWQPLAGRTVKIWPNRDAAGIKYAADVAARLLEIGCRVAVVDISKLGLPPKGDAVDWLNAHPGASPDNVHALPTRPLESPSAKPTPLPHGEDGAARCSEGAELVRVDRPRWAVYDSTVILDTGEKLNPGVYYHGWKDTRRNERNPGQFDTLVCGPLHVDAQTSDGDANNFGRLLRFMTSTGVWRQWAMPMELLSGTCEELRSELLSMGLVIEPTGRDLLARYLLSDREPARRVRCALQVGWCGQCFVLPDTVIGPGSDDVIFQSATRNHGEHGCSGTLDGWRSEVASLAPGNPLLLLAISAAFAGPLLRRVGAEGGGVHFYGDSSTGKTTILQAACSVWGGPNYPRTWRGTANGMEGAATLFNDCLLALDEISQADPREVGAIVYSLANGVGKQRATRSGSARGVASWLTFIISTGERTIATTMDEGGHKTKAGQSVRLLDLPAARGFGCFDDLHGHPSGTALSDALKQAVTTHYGHAGRAFVERLANDQSRFGEQLGMIKAHPSFNPPDAEGQDKRAAARFALIALAGEQATEYGITGWKSGAALDAAAQAFELWRVMRGNGNNERRQILEQVARFIERHGDSRFSDWTTDNVQVRDRAGWWRDTVEGRTYLFTAEGMRAALTGFDFKRALYVLEEFGVLSPKQAGGERAKVVRIGGRGSVRVYQVAAERLSGVEQ